MVEHYVIIQVGVLEHDKLGENSREWPETIRRLIERELVAWRARNPTRKILRTRSFATDAQCNVEFFHVDKSEIPPAGSVSADGTPAPPHSGVPSSPVAAPAQCMRCTD